MAFKNAVAELQPEIATWRQALHSDPELLFETHRTAAFVTQKLREFGVDEVVTGLGRTGVVGVIRGSRQTSGRVIGLRPYPRATKRQSYSYCSSSIHPYHHPKQ